MDDANFSHPHEIQKGNVYGDLYTSWSIGLFKNSLALTSFEAGCGICVENRIINLYILCNIFNKLVYFISKKKE